ncbi:MAG: FMN-binding protein [Myxococcota bacterium]
MKRLAGLLLIVVALVATRAAHAYVYFTPEKLMESFFPGGTTEAVTFTPDAAARDRIQAALGYDLPKPTYTLQVGTVNGVVAGYAVLDQQLGQHEPIDFGVLVGPDAKVKRVEVLVYREAYGDGVRAEAFRKQFVGLGLSAPMRAGKDIRVVSGATISTRSISTGVKRAVAIVSAYLGLPA